ncbi:hypothetical protein LCL99_17040 [Halomonas denitrificans]|nr:hypothetical protein [Halomonas denitrificans]MBY5969274.1 hypothetical protein [Halomonas denitrificans]MCA0976177.1 hypothetical protein [Halomonas denitrificans]
MTGTQQYFPLDGRGILPGGTHAAKAVTHDTVTGAGRQAKAAIIDTP